MMRYEVISWVVTTFRDFMIILALAVWIGEHA